MGSICSSPPTPDYVGAAQAQGQANLDAAIASSNLSNPNMVTPFGTTTFTPGATPSDRPTETQVLTPAGQQQLDTTNAIKQGSLDILNTDMPNIAGALSGPFGLAGGPMVGLDPTYAPGAGAVQTNANLGAAGPMQSGLNFAGAPGMPVADDATRQAVSNAIYQQGSQYLDPQFAQQQNDLDTSLANQGITQGSSAQQIAQHNLDLQKQQAYGNLIDQATQSGVGAMNTLFGEQLGARQQGVGETTAQGQFLNAAQQQAANELLQSMSARNSGVGLLGNLAQAGTQAYNAGRGQAYQEYATNRTMPINMLSGMLSSSQIALPQFNGYTPTSITPAPIMQGTIAQGQQDAANASANANLMGGLFKGGASLLTSPLGGTAMGALFGSDRRFKSNIKEIGALKNGLKVYSYTIGGIPAIGVMADEVEKVIPDAVHKDSAGYRYVDYSKVGEIACL